MTYKGHQSSKKKMPGGGPQGIILGMFLFLLLINDAGFAAQNSEIGMKIVSAINKRKEISQDLWKYVDDLKIAETLLLKGNLKMIQKIP